MNKVFLMGNLTQDCELKFAQTGTAICNFDIAVNSSFGSGENKKEEVLFMKITAFNKQAENCGKYLSKGKKVLVDGRIKTDSWENEAGVKQYKTYVLAQNVTFLSSAGEQKQDGAKKIDLNSIDEVDSENIPF